MPSTRKVSLPGGSGQTRQPHALEKEVQGGPQYSSEKLRRTPNFTDKKPGLRSEGARAQPHESENPLGPAVSFLALNVNSLFLGGAGRGGARLSVLILRVGLTC